MTSYTEDDLRQALSHSADEAEPTTDVWSGLHRRIVRRRRMRAGAVVVGAAAVIAGAVIAAPHLGGTDGGTNKVSPANGGGFTTSTLTPDRPLSDSDLGLAADFVRHRLDALGVDGATVATSGGRLTVTTPPSSHADIASVAQPGELQFRQVLERVAGGSGDLTHPAVVAAGDLTAAKHALADHPCVEAAAGADQPAPAASYLVTCSTDGASAYLLGPAALDNGDVAGAHAVLDTTTNQWIVQIDLNAAGADKFFALSRQAGQADPSGVAADCAPPKGCNGIAMLVDGKILSVPSVQDPNGIRGGQTQITGALTEDKARAIAAMATTDPLPAGFTVDVSGG